MKEEVFKKYLLLLLSYSALCMLQLILVELIQLFQVILTILTRLELAEERYVCLLPQTSVTCVLNFHMVGLYLTPNLYFLTLFFDRNYSLTL